MKKIFSLLCFFALTILAAKTNAQIWIREPALANSVKGGTTYVMIDNFSISDENTYREVFKKYWTFSKIEFIKSSEISKNVKPGCSFLTFGITSGDGGYTTFLCLWTLPEKFTSGKKTYVPESFQEHEIARLYYYERDDVKFSQEDYKAGRQPNYSYIGAGRLKNYLQLFSMLLDNGKADRGIKDFADHEELRKLANDTLYLTNDHLNKYSLKIKKKEGLTEEELMKEYKYPYQFISFEDLNKRILSDTTIYYFNSVRSYGSTYLTIINSTTGKIIYKVFQGNSIRIRTNDLEDVYDEIAKALK